MIYFPLHNLFPIYATFQANRYSIPIFMTKCSNENHSPIPTIHTFTARTHQATIISSVFDIKIKRFFQTTSLKKRKKRTNILCNRFLRGCFNLAVFYSSFMYLPYTDNLFFLLYHLSSTHIALFIHHYHLNCKTLTWVTLETLRCVKFSKE